MNNMRHFMNIINETITVANYQKKFKEELVVATKRGIQWYYDNLVKSLSDKKDHNSIYYTSKEEFIKIVLKIMKDLLNKYIKEVFDDYFPEVLNEIVKEIHPRIKVSFYIDYIVPRGAVLKNSTTMVLSILLIMDIVDKIEAVVLENSKLDYNIDKELVKILAKVLYEPEFFFDRPDVNEFFNSMAAVMTHEYVHLIQNIRQFEKGRKSTEYRSYLEKDQAKFKAAIRKLNSGQGYSPEDIELYHASPQEINAFATNIATDILKTSIGITAQDIKNQVLAHLKYDLKTMSPIQKKVFTRYLKQVYQILWHYHNQLSKN